MNKVVGRAPHGQLWDKASCREAEARFVRPREGSPGYTEPASEERRLN